MVLCSMQFYIQTPTRAQVRTEKDEELQVLKDQLLVTNKSVSYRINLHRKRSWLKDKDPIGYQETMNELQAALKTSLVGYEAGQPFIRPGSIPYLKNLDFEVVNMVKYPELKSIGWKSRPKFDPYDYQKSAVRELIEVKHGNISLPTGCGKSFILLMLARYMGLDAVVVTPSTSIFHELLDEFEARLGKGVVGAYGDGRKDIKKKITIAIGKSLTMIKPGTAAHEFFSKKKLMLVDESHTFAAEELHKVCHGVLSEVPYRMFVSATQTRNDGTEKVLHSIIGKNVLEMSLQEAIDGGYLCPLKFTVLETFTKDTRTIKDATKAGRAHFLYNENIAQLAAKIANASYRAKGESSLILVKELKQIQMLTKLLQVPYVYVHSADKKRAAEFGLEKIDLKEQVLAFNKGEVPVLIGTSAIATGTNIYPTHNCINWVGGSSEIVTKQGAMGRSTRILSNSDFAEFHTPKPHSMIWDFKVRNNPMLIKQLDKRCKWYKESGAEVKFI